MMEVEKALVVQNRINKTVRDLIVAHEVQIERLMDEVKKLRKRVEKLEKLKR